MGDHRRWIRRFVPTFGTTATGGDALELEGDFSGALETQEIIITALTFQGDVAGDLDYEGDVSGTIDINTTSPAADLELEGVYV